MKKFSFSLSLVLAIALAASAPAQEHLDPTASVIPDTECTSPSCHEAASAFASQDYGKSAELFTRYFDEIATEDDEAGAWLVHAAFAHQQALEWDQAAALYRRAADEVEALQPYLLVQAARAALRGSGDPQIFEAALATESLGTGFVDGFFLRARLEAITGDLPHVETVAAAFNQGNSEEICPWLLEEITGGAESDSLVALFNLSHGHCIDRGASDQIAALPFTPTHAARLQRAEQLFWAVRYDDALAELAAIDFDELTPVQRCQAEFRRARSHFRLRQYQSAHTIYEGVVEECTDAANEDERVRSLYAVGNRDYHQGRLDQAQSTFERLFAEYPQRSHADDALFYLARIARQREDQATEEALLLQALRDYPDGDMVHEMAWEVYASLFRDGEYQRFISAITTLPLPDWDNQYFSQGRLEYFVASAHAALGEIDQAARYWQLAWVKYPFSFYGYLSHLRLNEHEFAPEALASAPSAGHVPWFDESFLGTGAGILARAGHLEGACDFAAASLNRSTENIDDRWRVAALCHNAGRFDFSHNLVRRQIAGRPWSMPLSGQLVRWHIAWPNPFQASIESAVKELGPEPSSQALHPAFPSAIMREESSFIEDIVSWAGAVGLMQLMPATARDHENVIEGKATVDRLKTAAINIPVGVDHLAHLARRFDGHPVLMTAAYNAGAGRINGWLRRQPNDEIALWVEDIPFLETRNYTKRVIGSYAAYQFLHGEVSFDDRVAEAAR